MSFVAIGIVANVGQYSPYPDQVATKDHRQYRCTHCGSIAVSVVNNCRNCGASSFVTHPPKLKK